MPSLLPSNHRSLRHVLQFTARYVPIIERNAIEEMFHDGVGGGVDELQDSSSLPTPSPSPSSSSESGFVLTLRCVEPDGRPSEKVLFESEVCSRTVHPLWHPLPDGLRLNPEHSAISHLVASVYFVNKGNHKQAVMRRDSAMDATTTSHVSSPTTTTATAVGTPSRTRDSHASSAFAPSETTTLQQHQQEGGDEMMSNLSPSSSGLSSPLARQQHHPHHVVPPGSHHHHHHDPNSTGHEEPLQHHHSNTTAEGPLLAPSTPLAPSPPPPPHPPTALEGEDDSMHLVFECLMDLNSMDVIAKNVASLAELDGPLPAHLESGSPHCPLTLLVRCEDGVFFPKLIGGSAVRRKAQDEMIPRQQLPPALLGRLSAAVNAVANGAGGGSVFHENQALHDWDFVDGDAVREAEARTQRSENISLADVKAFSTATLGLHETRRIFQRMAEERKDAIDLLLEKHEAQIAAAANRVATDSIKAKAAQSIPIRLEEIAVRRKSLNERREALTARKAELTAAITDLQSARKEEQEQRDETTVVRSPLTSPSPLELLAARLQDARRQLVGPMAAQYFAVSSAKNTICGISLPTELTYGPETPDHAMAVSHICHALVTFASIHHFTLPHPVLLAPGRCRIAHRVGAPPEQIYPLYPVTKGSERQLVKMGMELLKQNIMIASFQVHQQRTAEGLPLLMALEKLLLRR